MAVKAKKGKPACPLEAGNTLLKILDVSQVESDYGDMAEIIFKAYEGDHEGEKFSQRFSLVVSSQSYLGAMIKAIDGIIIDQEEYDISQYEGKIVGANIGVRPKSKSGGIGIIGFYPPGKPGKAREEKPEEGKENDIPI